jgi:hypothetical protein
VAQRQKAEGSILRSHREGGIHCPYLVKKIGMGQNGTLWISGGAGCIDDGRRVLGSGGLPPCPESVRVNGAGHGRQIFEFFCSVLNHQAKMFHGHVGSPDVFYLFWCLFKTEFFKTTHSKKIPKMPDLHFFYNWREGV